MRSSPLADRTVVVTGAARGLGAAMARQIAGRGARVALLGHEKHELEALAEELPVPTLALEADITDPDALADAQLGKPAVVDQGPGEP